MITLSVGTYYYDSHWKAHVIYQGRVADGRYIFLYMGEQYLYSHQDVEQRIAYQPIRTGWGNSN